MPPTQKDHVQTGLKRPPGSFSEDPARPGDHAGEAAFKKRRTDQQTLLRAGAVRSSSGGSEPPHQFARVSYLTPREHVESPPVSPMSKPLDGPVSTTDSSCSSTPSRGQDLKASRS